MEKDDLMMALAVCLDYDPDQEDPCCYCPLKEEHLCTYKLLNEVAKIVYASRDIKFLMPEKE